MNATKKLLDKFSKTCASATDKAIAERLHVRQSAVSNWRSERAHPDADSIEKMALAIGELPGPWLASIEADRARTPAARLVWLRLAQTFGVSLTLALILSLPSHAAHAAQTTGHATAKVGICINSRYHGPRR